MTYSIEFARRITARARHGVLAGFIVSAGACAADGLHPLMETESTVESVGSDVSGTRSTVPSYAGAASRQGIPFGFWRLEYSQLGPEWTSLKKTGSPKSIRRDLDLARSRGGRVFVQFAGGIGNYQAADHRFDLEKFNQKLDLYKALDLDSYIADGTLAGHMMIDEPSDASNWGGQPIPYAALEAAAAHSKSLWPGLPTLVRSRPTWLAKAPFRWQHLDGGWGQYVARFGDVNRYRDTEALAAQNAGLTVAWGLNVLDGGDGSSQEVGTKAGKFTMTPDELLRYGKALIEAPGSCGFLMWMYESNYLADAGVLSAMKSLSQTASARAPQPCGDAALDDGTDPDVEPGQPPPVPPTGGVLGVLAVTTWEDATKQYVLLKWSGASGAMVDVYRDGRLIKNTENDGRYTNSRSFLGDITYIYRICEAGSSTCSDEAIAQFGGVASPPNAPPLAAFTWSCTGLTCAFSDQSTDADGNVAVREWDLGDGHTATGSSYSYTYAAVGNPTVTLKITDNGGATDTHVEEITVTPPNASPAASFSSQCANLTCTFTDLSSDADGSVASWSWDFGDGGSSTAPSPSHTYAAVGNPTVTLKITDNGGATDTHVEEITVTPPNASPAASFSSQCANLTCTFTDLSSDADGSVASWSWDFGDGGSSTAPSPSHTYAAGGSYQATLTATDDDAATGSFTQTVTATAPSPIVLSLAGRVDATKQYITLTWTGATGTTVDVYRDGKLGKNEPNDGRYTNSRNLPGASQYTYKVCQAGTTICSNEATVEFGAGSPPPPPPSAIGLSLAGWVDATKKYIMLTWTGATGTTVDVYRDGKFWKNEPNDGRYTNSRNLPGASQYTYKVCQAGTSICANDATMTFD